jgi:hypothetical protein
MAQDVDQFRARHDRHDEVENDQSDFGRGSPAQNLESLHAVATLENGETFVLESVTELETNVVVVLDDENRTAPSRIDCGHAGKPAVKEIMRPTPNFKRSRTSDRRRRRCASFEYVVR